MSLVVDASVIVAAHRVSEPMHPASARFLAAIESRGLAIRCPSLNLPECASAIMRGTKNSALAHALVQLISSAPHIQLDPMDRALWSEAAETATDCELRGADAVYVALASHHGVEQVSWDREMLQRSRSLVSTATSDEWLAAHPDVEN